MDVQNSDTLSAFASTRKVVSLLAKARIKYEMKVSEARDGERRVPEMDPQLMALMPSSFRFGRKHAGDLQEALTNYLMHRIEEKCDEPYVTRLVYFVRKIQGIAESGDFCFEKPRIIPKLKEKGSGVYRPLSAYSDLTTKIVISLVSEWFSETFDRYFHYEMLAYRRRREYHGHIKQTTNKDAVGTIEEYRRAHDEQDIFVAECDIQKFFDIVNHSVVMDCFDRMESAARVDRPDLDMSSARKLLGSFLDSYSFYMDVFAKNMDEEFWKESLGKAYDPTEGHEFKWIKLSKAKELDPLFVKNLGIPQGAALSTVLTNIILSSVDGPVIAENDPDRLFVRFCDDILLMHTDYGKCCELADAYAESLAAHKLVYHEFKNVATLRNGKRVGACGIPYDENADYWNAKSKLPFLWGTRRDDPNSAEWIGFLGFEFNRDGNVRMRRSSVGKKVDKMLQDYNQIRFGSDVDLKTRHLDRFRKLRIEIPDDRSNRRSLLSSHSGITDNSYTRRQISLLQKFHAKHVGKLSD